MKNIFILFLCFISFYSCREKVDFSDDNGLNPRTAENLDSTIIKHGTWFGECLGYCTTQTEIELDQIKFTLSSRDSYRYPDKVYYNILNNREELLSLIDYNKLRGMKNEYGCPDCADGGGEWIEISNKNFYKKIVFEYGDTLSPIYGLLEKMREIRSRYVR